MQHVLGQGCCALETLPCALAMRGALAWPWRRLELSEREGSWITMIRREGEVDREGHLASPKGQLRLVMNSKDLTTVNTDHTLVRCEHTGWWWLCLGSKGAWVWSYCGNVGRQSTHRQETLPWNSHHFSSVLLIPARHYCPITQMAGNWGLDKI